MESVCRRVILGRRVGRAMGLCAALQVLVLLVILTPLTVNAWQPSLWLRNLMNILQYIVGYTLPLSVILCVVCLINNEDIESGKKLLPSRFSTVRNLFTLRNMGISSSYTLIGGLFFYLYASLIGGEYGKLVTDCTGYRCLLERHMYLILCGFWIGQTYFLKNYVFDNQPVMIHFVIQQSKLRQVKSEMKPLIKKAFQETVWPTIFFGLAYYFKGDSTRDKFCEMFYMKFEDDPLTAQLINITLLLYSWFLGSMFFISMNSVKMILQVFMMDHMTFPITKPAGNLNYITLHQALQMKTLPAIQHLGYHDLMILSATDARRREELFSLSQPGGHPHNWNAIVEECLQFVNNFTAELSDISTPTVESFTPAPKPPIVSQEPTPQSPFNNQPTNLMPAPFSPITSPGGMRNLSAQPVGLVAAPHHVTAQTLASRVQAQIKLAKENIVKRPLIAYVFGDLPDAKVNYIFSKGQPVIWAAQSLALLAAASYTEDQYGVAQKDLPAIIAALLNLKQIIDKLQKSGIYKKIPRNEHYNVKLRHGIRSAVKRSLYRITVTFGNHLQELPMPKGILVQVQNFVMNREC